ncbi:hypothetical protein Q9X91_004638 [Vibrio alginolyticus]|nr:hypothetical protein [Vibrio alginolyticus]
MVKDYSKNIGFVQIDARYTLAAGFKSKETGEVIPFDGVDFKIVTFITQREAYFKNMKHSPYFESLDKICTATTGKPHTDHGGNKNRIKKLLKLGLLNVDTTKTGRIKNKGKKSICKLDEVLKRWDIVNDALSTFDTPEAAEQRKVEKDKRLDIQKQREEDRKQPCDGSESYFKDHPPVEAYDLPPAPDAYDDGTDANWGFADDINTTLNETYPNYFMCDTELASYEQYLMVDEDTAEREEESANVFTNSCDGNLTPSSTEPTLAKSSPFDLVLFSKSQMSQMKEDFDRSLKQTLEDAGVTHVDEAPTEVTASKGDKSKLVGLIGSVDISDVDVDSKGVGWFAAPLTRGELNIVDTKRWLKVLHTHFWDDYSPDYETVEAIRKKLTCECCGNKVDDLGYCTDRDCEENEMSIPF